MRRTDAPLLIGAALGGLLLAWISLDLWSMRWDVPLVYSGDALAVASHFKTVLETGWYEYQPALGAPFGQVYHDYPTSENLHFLTAALLGLATNNWAVAMNLHFVLGFPLAALTMVWFLRRLRVSAATAVVVALLFSIAPYHFSRGEGHLFLAWYWVVPLALWLLVLILRGEPLWGRREGGGALRGHALGQSGQTLLILALLGTASTYYSAFTLVLGGVAALGAVLVTKHWRRLLGAAAAAGALVVVLLINMAPDLLYRLANGANPGALQRTPVETEIYALKLAQLLLPASGHRFEPFAQLRRLYDENYPLPSEGIALGLLGSVGFIALVAAVFIVLAQLAARTTTPLDGLTARLAPLGFLALCGFLFATVGGLSTLVSFVSTNLRAWNRMSIVLTALALAALAILLDAVITRVATSRLGLVGATAVVLAPVLLLGAWDQSPPANAAARQATEASFDSDAAFVAALEREVPEGSMLFQLPYIAFPESPAQHGMLDADQLRMHLHSSTLRFSGGGIRGRDDIDSLEDVAALADDALASAISELGYAGVIIDARGFATPEEADELADSIGGGDIRSDDGRFIFVPVPPAAAGR